MAPRAKSRKSPPGPSSTRAQGWVEIATQPFVLLSIVHLTVLGFGLPLISEMPGWFYPLTRKELGPAILLIVLAAIPAFGWWLVRALRRRWILAIGALVLLGYGLQQGFAWSEGRGVAGMRDRIVRSGHAEFAEVAVQQSSLWRTLSSYETLVRREELGRYAHTKPPGQLLFYMVTERLARPLATDASPTARLEALRDLATWTWPLISYLVLIPLFLTIRAVLDERTAFLACLLYLVVPSVALVTLHTDQVLFPLLFVLVLWTAVKAQVQRSLPWAVAAGLSSWVAGWFSFPLLLSAPIGLSFAAAGTQAEGPLASRAMAVRWTAMGMALGLAIGYGVGILTGYSFFDRLDDATRVHAAWKVWQPGPQETLYWAWLDLLEFGLWIGVPLSVLVLAYARRASRAAAAGSWRGLVAPAIATLATIAFLAFFGRTKGETARLWLPFATLACAFAANEILEREPSGGRMVPFVLALQWLTIWLTKVGQDF